MVLERGAMVSGYRIESVVGSGGMGTVYLADNPVLPRRDALKVLSAELSADPAFRARFLREADLAATLDHPNIVTVYSRGQSDSGQLWIAMQYVPGSDAQQECEAARMTPARAVRIVGEVAKALDYAHRTGLVHRDVKPANFLLTDGDERILLADFGIARALDDAAGLTGAGNILATVDYAAPEMLAGGQVDGRADIYALGCSLFRMLTGRTPYAGAGGVPAVLAAHLYAAPPKVTDVAPELPAALDAVIATAMAKDPTQRYPTAGALAAAADAALENSGGTAEWEVPAAAADAAADAAGRGATTVPPPRRRRGGRRAAVIGSITAAALAATVGVVLVRGAGPDYREQTITHSLGVTRIDTQPRAVAAVGPGDADAVLSLGVQPVAVITVGGALPGYLQSLVEGSVKTLASLDQTALAITRPDLIIDTGEVDQAIYNQMTAIAPTLTRPDGGTWSWQNQLSWIGDALGRPDSAREVIAAAAARLSTIRTAHPAFADKTVVAVTVTDDGVSAATPGSPAAAYLEGLGMRYAGGLPDAPAGQYRVAVDPAALNSDPTAVRIVVRTDRAAGDGNYNGLPDAFSAYRGATIIVDDPEAVTALDTGGPAATAFLDRYLVDLIAEQVH
jgi:ABC-type Fe3+-hydroxamate transport system substrate-binding protein